MSAHEKDPEQLLVDILTSDQLEIIKKWERQAVAAALDDRWKLLDKQVEYLRKISSQVPGVLDVRLSLDSAANTIEFFQDMLQHERQRAEAKLALVDKYGRDVWRMGHEECEFMTFDEWFSPSRE